jgi:hypothetical protein
MPKNEGIRRWMQWSTAAAPPPDDALKVVMRGEDKEDIVAA